MGLRMAIRCHFKGQKEVFSATDTLKDCKLIKTDILIIETSLF